MTSKWKWSLEILTVIAVLSLLVSVGFIVRSLLKRTYLAPISSTPTPVPETFNLIAPKSTFNQSTSSASTDQNTANREVKNQPLYFYQNQRVDRVNGTFAKLTARKLLEVNLNGEIKWFVLDKNTKLVCQPSGYLNTEDGAPADDVFIEDKTDKNIGIPWGIEITTANIITRVNPQSEVQIYFQPQPGSLTGMPKIMYIWFKQCD